MVDGHQSFRLGNVHSSSGTHCIPFQGCQSFWMMAQLEPMSLSFHGPWSEDQSQLHINILEVMAIRLTLKKAIKYVHHSCVMISTDNTAVVSYINKQGGTHSPNLCVEVWRILHWCLEYDIGIRVCHIPGKFNILVDHLSRLDRPLKTEWALDQLVANAIFQMLNYPNVDLFATRFNYKLPVLDNHALMTEALSMNWNCLHAFPLSILIPSILAKIRQSQCRTVLIAPLWPQYPWFSEVLQLLVHVSTPIHLLLFPRLLTQANGKFQHPNLPLLQLHAWELTMYQTINKHKKFSQRVADFVSKPRRECTQ